MKKICLFQSFLDYIVDHYSHYSKDSSFIMENNNIGCFKRFKQALNCCRNNKHKIALKTTCEDTCCCHGKQVLVVCYDEKSSDSDSTDISITEDNKVKIS